LNNPQKWRAICTEMQNAFPVLANPFMLAESRFGAHWVDEAVPAIEGMYGEITAPLSDQLKAALACYAEFANDSMRHQVMYERTGKYRASNYEEVRAALYDNADHMTQNYLPGLWFSHYVWPQHYFTLVGFTSCVLPRVVDAGVFFEVGVGCGMYSKMTLDLKPSIRGVGFDISQHSLDYTGRVMRSFGYESRYKLENRDIRHGYDVKADFLICQEVLEHLENPAEFCCWLFEMIRPGGQAFVTAALNAGHSDHIFLIHHPVEVEKMLNDAGFLITRIQEENAPGAKPRNLTPSLAGFLCAKPV
jgi:2-polyprenyl-3-methyl-5-hydroxy-6-metoxy-1,4-benzoquinol methylase